MLRLKIKDKKNKENVDSTVRDRLMFLSDYGVHMFRLSNMNDQLFIQN